MPQKIQPVDVESRFDLDELFFSTTDRKGRIRSGNSVFCRVAKYELHEMLGEPHSLIRHPDMPRAVFKLLWDTILDQRPIAAYVKNMAADGSYYWVLATVVPIPGQEAFLSVRLKPSSNVCGVIEKAYAAMRAVELEHEERGDRARGLEASLAMLPEILQSIDYPDYESFMHAVLPLELAARDAGRRPYADRQPTGSNNVGRTADSLWQVRSRCQEVVAHLDTQFAEIDTFIELGSEFDNKSRFVNDLARSVRLASLNATAAASRIGPTGATLALIATAIGENAESGSALAIGLERKNERTIGLLRRAAFHASIARLQMEMAMTFVDERIQGDGEVAGRSDADEGLNALLLSLADSVRELFSAYGGVIESLTPLTDELAELRRLVQLLEITHVTGVIEANRVSEAAGFHELLIQVGSGVERARTELREFLRAIDSTHEGIERLVRNERSIVESLDSIATVVAV